MTKQVIIDKTLQHVLLIIGFLLFSVGCTQSENEDGIGSKTAEEHEPTEEHHKHHGQSANEYMHESSMEELIERFESPEREAYQQPVKVLEFLGDLEGKKIMDIGAGSGYFSLKLAAKGADVIAADVSDEFQAFLRERIHDQGIKNIELRKLPYDSPALKENEVDMVLIVNTYHHIENRPSYFSNVRKGTKNEGELVLIDFFKTEIPVGPPVDHKIAVDQVVAELKEAGYSRFEVNVDLLPYQYIIRAK